MTCILCFSKAKVERPFWAVDFRNFNSFSL